jgi:hypothetical protein
MSCRTSSFVKVSTAMAVSLFASIVAHTTSKPRLWPRKVRKGTMLKHPEGTNPDGSVRFRYELTDQEVADGYAMFVSGPIAGTFEIDGTPYDVTEYALPVKVEHVDKLHLAIHRAHHANGRFLDIPLPTTS